MDFELVSPFEPTGDQPEAIKSLVKGIEQGEQFQTLLGVTGSGKTFTVANLVKELNRPTLVLSHNKTLAAQLYGEFKQFFPNNAVEYFVSYYDYYQPEAYLPVTDTFIEKDMSINEEIEKLQEAENLQKNELYRNEAEKKVVYEYLITENLSFTNYSNEKIKIDYHPVVTIYGVHSCM